MAQDVVLPLDGEVVEGGDFSFVDFDVPAGTVELEVAHDSTGASVLDWGLIGPDGTTRGWGGGNGESITIGQDAASRSYLPGIDPGRWQVAIGKARLVESPAPYTLAVTLRTRATLERRADRGAYVVAPALESGARWYAGDFHVHSLESGDASASLDQIADLARQRGLDFVVVTDHNTTAHDDFLTAAQVRHPDVLFIPGMELTTYRGHMGLYGTTAYHDHGLHGPFSVADLVDAVHAEGGLVAINHPALDLGDACIGCAFEHDLTGIQVDAVEIQTGGLEPVGGLFTDAAIAFWEARGTVAAVGGSDDHRAGRGTGFTDSAIGSPTTMVYADELSVAAILEGVRRRRTVVKLQEPEDPMIDLQPTAVGVRVEGEGGERLLLLREGVVIVDEPLDGGPYQRDFEIDFGPVRAEVWLNGSRRTATSAVDVTSVGDKEPPRRCGCGTTAVPWRSLLGGLLLRRR